MSHKVIELAVKSTRQQMDAAEARRKLDASLERELERLQLEGVPLSMLAIERDSHIDWERTTITFTARIVMLAIERDSHIDWERTTITFTTRIVMRQSEGE